MSSAGDIHSKRFTIPLAVQIAVAAIGWMLFAGLAPGQPSIFPTGVTRYDPNRAYNSYVLFSSTDGRTYLIDRDGNVVHQWDRPGFPSVMLDPKITGDKRGHVLVQLADKGSMPAAIMNNRVIGELDWDGKAVWAWGSKAPGGAAYQNHDFERLPNGDTLVLALKRQHVKGFKGVIADQVIYEVNPSGNIVWNWDSLDHVREFGFDSKGLALLHAEYSYDGGAVGLFTINAVSTQGPNRWYDAGNRTFAPGNILISSRDGNFLAIIDQATGKVIWRIGPYYRHQPGSIAPMGIIYNNTLPRPVDQLSGQHDARVIPEGLPGAGDILVLDNEGSAGYPPGVLDMMQGSRVLEINPVTKQIVWQYTGVDSGREVWAFDTFFMGSAQRLPNGNTFICEAEDGRLFEVTPKGDIVWEYVNPYFVKNTDFGGSFAGNHPVTVKANWLYRAQAVPYDWAPPGTPRAQRAVIPQDVTAFRVPQVATAP